MREIKNHKVYELLDNKYDNIALDYVIMSLDKEYEGVVTHQKAVIEAFEIINARNVAYYGCEYKIEIDEDKMKASISDMEELLQLPNNDYYDNKLKKERSFSSPNPIPYWFAFLEPPHGNSYLKNDFIEFNKLLFPNRYYCDVYRWNDEFSNYFDDGKEWWGTGLWSIYDQITGVIVIIGVSLTD